MPGRPAVQRHLDPADNAAAGVLRGPRHRHRRSLRDRRLRGRRGDHRRRCRAIGRRGGRDHSRSGQVRGRGAHVGEQIDRGLLHRHADRFDRAVVAGVQTPGPLNGAGAEDQRAAAGPVHRQVVRGRPGGDLRAEVLQVLRRRTGGGRQPDQAGRPVPVVQIFVRFVADGVRGQFGARPVRLVGQRRVAPQPEPALLGRHGDRQVGEVRLVGRAGEGVLGNGRLEPGISPRPGRALGIQHGAGEGVLVGHHRPVGCVAAVLARLPADLPIDLVAREERQIDPGVPRGLDVRPLTGRPVLVMAHGQEGLLGEDLLPADIGVQTGDVGHVVPVGFQEPDHRVLVGEQEIALLDATPGGERPVVAQLVGATVDQAPIQAGSAVRVVRLPGRVGGLEHDLAGGGVVAHDKRDVAGPVGVGADQPGDVDAGHGGRRHRPGGRHTPGSAVVDLGGRVGRAGRLTLRQGGRRGHIGDLPGAVALVVAEPVDLDAVSGRVGLDLEVDGLPSGDAHLGGETLDRLVTGAVDVPDRFRRTRQLVLAGDLIFCAVGRGRGSRQRDRHAQHHHQAHPRRGGPGVPSP